MSTLFDGKKHLSFFSLSSHPFPSFPWNAHLLLHFDCMPLSGDDVTPRGFYAAINTLPNCSATCCYGSHSATLFCMFAYMISLRKFPWCTVQRLLCLQQQHLPQVFPSLQQPQPTRFANLQLPFLRTTLNQCFVITLCSPFLLLAYVVFLTAFIANDIFDWNFGLLRHSPVTTQISHITQCARYKKVGSCG